MRTVKGGCMRNRFLDFGFCGFVFFFLSGTLFCEEKPSKEKAAKAKKFTLQSSAIQTAERLIQQEKDVSNKTLLLLRWVKLKEDVEIEQAVAQKDEAGLKRSQQVKEEILARLEAEFTALNQPTNRNLDRLSREIGLRLVSQARLKEAWPYFKRITQKVPEDHLNMADSLLANAHIEPALEAYQEAAKSERLKSVVAYKQGWAYLQLKKFEQAQEFFELAMQDNPHMPARLKEEAFNDRLLVLIQNFKKPSFEPSDAQELRALAIRIKGNEKEGEALYQKSLQTLLNGFTADGKVDLAKNVYDQIQKSADNENEVLLNSVPMWLKTYRGQLDHASLEKTLQSLPSAPIDSQKYSGLHAELNNTALFYETIMKDKPDAALKALTLLVYQKYFDLFPKDEDSDDLRVNYAKTLFDGGHFKACITVTELASKKDPALKKLVEEWEVRCRLRQLDEDYKAESSPTFAKDLREHLLASKTYARNDLGFEPSNLFENLSRMLIGKIKTEPESQDWNSLLSDLMASYPMPKDTKLYEELSIISKELKFKRVMSAAAVSANALASSEVSSLPSGGNEAKALEFYQIYEDSPQGSEIREKSLRNAVLLSEGEPAVKRCEEYLSQYRDLKTLKPKDPVFDHCVKQMDLRYQISLEYSFWIVAESFLDADQKLRLSLLELALGKPEGEKRLLALKSDVASKALSLWKEDVKEAEISFKPLESLISKTDKFQASLKPIKFAQIQKVLPANLKSFNVLEKAWVDAAQEVGKTQPVFMGLILERRLYLNVAMRDWVKNLPEPKGLTPEELNQYRTQAASVLKPWDDRVAARSEDCALSAYSLSPQWMPKNQELCPEKTSEERFNEYIAAWEKTRRSSSSDEKTESEKLADGFLARGQEEKNELQARYFLLRALDLFEKEVDKARAHLALAKLLGRERFWRSAAALNGSLVEPIEWNLKRTQNPFFKRVYEKEIELARK